jgi:hypothetical protein
MVTTLREQLRNIFGIACNQSKSNHLGTFLIISIDVRRTPNVQYRERHWQNQVQLLEYLLKFPHCDASRSESVGSNILPVFDNRISPCGGPLVAYHLRILKILVLISDRWLVSLNQSTVMFLSFFRQIRRQSIPSPLFTIAYSITILVSFDATQSKGLKP